LLDESGGRISLTLRPADLKVADLQSEGAVADIVATFQSYVSERCSVLEEMKLAQDTTPRSMSMLARAFVPGGRVVGHVTSLVDDSAMVELDGGVVGKITKASLHGTLKWNWRFRGVGPVDLYSRPSIIRTAVASADGKQCPDDRIVKATPHCL
jgi:hypothetical protein